MSDRKPFMTEEYIREAQECSTEDVIESIKELEDIFGLLGLVPALAYRIKALEEELSKTKAQLKACGLGTKS